MIVGKFNKEFHNWTSGNKEIDEFIQQTQLTANKFSDIIEWVPFNKLTKIKYLAKGGFGTVFKAIWTDGYIYGYDSTNINKWIRNSQTNVCLKSLHNSKDINKDFLEEVENQHYHGGDSAIAIYGITKNPQDSDYMIVMQYAEQGSLRKLLDSKYYDLTWISKIDNLYYIANGLYTIHEAGLVHKDFHSGNIVNESFCSSFITDFGLCKPVSQDSNSIELFGVLPYVAPEILKMLDASGKNEIKYTQPSDIYSFGIIMTEIFNGYPPYYDIPHDNDLALKICMGQRPETKHEIPQLLLDLMNNCLDDRPENRPSAKELVEKLKQYRNDVSNEKTELYRQVKAIENLSNSNEKFSSRLIYKIHEKANYTSSCLSKSLNLQKGKQ
ncbi:kinase-like domain-containing protein [Gigaspora rosea]|uniref:Kinase-like domain-containing protein n=1 Tax=Gigaspora rosea TaxID=44941 RepID=A0A397U2G3_9GLOM|nr:kinase-like domain-containing protein [Gigaspora rosea]